MFPVRSSVYIAAIAVLLGMVECGCYNRLSSFVSPACVPAYPAGCPAACPPVCPPAYTACPPVCPPAYTACPPLSPACPPYPTAYPVPYLQPQCVSPYYDINQLYAVTKALDCSCGNNCNNSCLNVDQLLNKLVNALVYTTAEGGKGSGGGGGSGSGSSEPLISLDLLSKLTGGGLGIANLGLGGTDVLDATLGKVLG